MTVKKLLRGVGLISAFAAVALIASCTTKIWDAVHAPTPALPRLLADLPVDLQPGAQEQFAARLADRFPVGTSEVQVMRALWLDGFKPVIGPQADPRTAIFDTMGDGAFRVCRIDSKIHWSADEQGRLTSISGRYHTACL